MRSDPGLTQGQRENLDIINRSGEHLLSLINDVLDMAKIEASRVVLEVEPFDLGALVRDVTNMLGKRAEEKGLQLLLDQSSEFPRFIKSDKEKLRQVIVNLPVQFLATQAFLSASRIPLLGAVVVGIMKE